MQHSHRRINICWCCHINEHFPDEIKSCCLACGNPQPFIRLVGWLLAQCVLMWAGRESMKVMLTEDSHSLSGLTLLQDWQGEDTWSSNNAINNFKMSIQGPAIWIGACRVYPRRSQGFSKHRLRSKYVCQAVEKGIGHVSVAPRGSRYWQNPRLGGWGGLWHSNGS